MTEKKNLHSFQRPENWIMLFILIVVMYGGAGFFLYCAVKHPSPDQYGCECVKKGPGN